MKKIFNLLLVIFFAVSCKQKSEDFTKYVDPFIGTAGHGHVFPGACMPFGMVQLSPDNNHAGWDWCSGYHYSWDTIAGFSHTHLSGTGCQDLLDISFMPTLVEVTDDTSANGQNFMKKFYSTFSHANETAHPGYYSVKLNNGVNVELTTTLRSGFHKYTFPKSNNAVVMLDLGFSPDGWDKTIATLIKAEDNQLITGHRFSSGWAANQKVFFAARISKPIEKLLLINENGTISNEKTEIKCDNPWVEKGFIDKGVKAALIFSTEESESILIKVGISSVSEEAALKNLDTENTGWNFNEIKDKAQLAWNEALSKIKVESKNEKAKNVFYTALYHTMVTPALYSDVDGKYRAPGDTVKESKNSSIFYTFSLWDTFRAANPLYTITNPDQANEFVKSFITHYKDYGLLPVWSLWGNETYCMIGYHSIPIITDAYFKGLLKDIDANELFAAMKNSAMGIDSTKDHKALPLYLKYGFLPYDEQAKICKAKGWGEYGESASRTLEWAYDDWCIAQFAKSIGKNDEYEYFYKRSKAYEFLADSSTKFMRPRNADKTWLTPFDPNFAAPAAGFTEGNSWQYSWFVPQNVEFLIDFMGGKEGFTSKLDSLFIPKPGDESKNKFSDVSGLIGQYAHGNEPSHHVAYLYNYVGKPWKTQKIVNTILDSLYTDTPDGLCGNEDCGQMSAWYVFSAMGFYPVNPSNQQYIIGKPIFEKVTINLSKNKPFTIIANNLSKENIYIQSVKLNGKEYTKNFINHIDIINGGALVFEMSNTPNMNWGSLDVDLPISNKITE